MQCVDVLTCDCKTSTPSHSGTQFDHTVLVQMRSAVCLPQVQKMFHCHRWNRLVHVGIGYCLFANSIGMASDSCCISSLSTPPTQLHTQQGVCLVSRNRRMCTSRNTVVDETMASHQLPPADVLRHYRLDGQKVFSISFPIMRHACWPAPLATFACKVCKEVTDCSCVEPLVVQIKQVLTDGTTPVSLTARPTWTPPSRAPTSKECFEIVCVRENVPHSVTKSASFLQWHLKARVDQRHETPCYC